MRRLLAHSTTAFRSGGLALAVVALVLAGCSSQDSEGRSQEDTAQASEEKGWVVGLGDSFMSGEGGRWATNGAKNGAENHAKGFPDPKEKLGHKISDAAYHDSQDRTREEIRGCHRSQSAAMNVGDGYQFKNLACSGAITSSVTDEDKLWKPGLDFVSMGGFNPGSEKKGQALMLQEFAQDHNVEAVTVSIGGNDMGFSDIITACATAYAKGWFGKGCSKDKTVTSKIDDRAKQQVSSKVATALQNVQQAMQNAGYEPSQWRLIFQGPPAVIPLDKDTRVKNSGYDRQNQCGLPFDPADQDWAVNKVGPFLQQTQQAAIKKANLDVPVTFLNVMELFAGHKLCEKGAATTDKDRVDPNPNWLGSGASSEWVRRINLCEQGKLPNCSSDKTAIWASEPMHPTYWGQRALAQCTLAAIQSPRTTTVETCTLAKPQGVTPSGDPKVEATPTG